MYFPYFRGKQFELILLRDNAAFLAENQISPIIEPVKSNFAALIRAVKKLNEADVQCTLIVNPIVGESPVETESILSELIDKEFDEYSNISIGYILHPKSRQKDLINLLKHYKKKSFTLVHYGFTESKTLSTEILEYQNVKTHVFIDGYAGKLYQRHFKHGNSDRVLIRDGFKSQKKNSLYPPSEHFSDLHITFEDEGMDGFGDFLTVGDNYTETGGPAYAVALHLTYLDSDDDMFIYHFISDQNNSPVDPGGKFLEALSKLIRELTKNNSTLFMSEACNEYQILFNKQHFPGLGLVKKLSMQHHIELIAEFQSRD